MGACAFNPNVYTSLPRASYYHWSVENGRELYYLPSTPADCSVAALARNRRYVLPPTHPPTHSQTPNSSFQPSLPPLSSYV